MPENKNPHFVSKAQVGKVILPSGTEIRYEYDKRNPLGPARRYRNGALTTEFVWFDPLRLALYRDYPNALEYAFA